MDLRLVQQKLFAAEGYRSKDPDVLGAHQRAQALAKRYSASAPDQTLFRTELLEELLGAVGKDTLVEPPFLCDFGFNITIGSRVYVNYNCVFLDCHRIDIGNNVKVGPGVHIYAVNHPLSAEKRRTDLEYGKPVRIGNDVWIGGGAIILPGVTIGDGVTIGAGSVVVHDIPGGVLAVGNPCRVVRSIENP